jgi:hypothetical protein
MKTGRALLIRRKDSLDREIPEIENAIGKKLPPEYKAFITDYEQGGSGLDMEREYRADIDYHDITGPASYSKGLKKEIIIDHFYDPEELISTWESIDHDEETGKKGLLKIADLGSDPNGGLYVGVAKDNKDEIYRVNWEMDNMFERITGSIWDFIEGLKQGK